jgi:hypothetical protein
VRRGVESSETPALHALIQTREVRWYVSTTQSTPRKRWGRITVRCFMPGCTAGGSGRRESDDGDNPRLLLALALCVDMNLVSVGVNQLPSLPLCVMYRWAVVMRTLGSVGYVFALQGIWRGICGCICVLTWCGCQHEVVKE